MNILVNQMIEKIESAGFEAYLVGGSVRDFLLELPGEDYDLATNATPEEVKHIFRDFHVIETGIKHGTLTVMHQQTPFEITTFRTDATYSDHRRPDSVSFSASLQEDLARRDFTINALAYHPLKGTIDPFNGTDDLINGVLRAVGNPLKRMEEDPLRILRGLRFISRFGLSVEADTHKALLKQRDLLFYISPERIFSELKKILLGPAVERVLLDYAPVFESIIPEITPMIGYDQLNPYHDKDLWTHTAAVVANAPTEVPLRLAALLHDIGKPSSRTLDEQGVAHYYGHEELSDEMARRILRNLRSDNKTLLEVSQLIRYHDHALSLKEPKLKEWLAKLGDPLLFKLIHLKEADLKAQDPQYLQDRLQHLQQVEERIKIMLHGNVAFTRKSLAINGSDLVSQGITEGTLIGLILDRLLKEVMQDKLPNEKQALIDRAHQLK